jgi:ADP-ribose pyrophosphatase
VVFSIINEVEKGMVIDMSDEIKRLKRELQCEGRITKYYKDTVELPDGRTEQWDFVGHNGAAAAIGVLHDGRLLMVRQYRNALDRYTLEIPAGGLNKDESTDHAAARELEEETGYKCAKLEKPLSLRTTVAFCNEKIDIYVASELTKTHQRLDDDEYLNVEVYTLDELVNKICSFEIEDSKTIAAIMTYKAKISASTAV